jgi:hypothetical protein
MTKNKPCPRCNASFECKKNDIASCQCNTIVLSEATSDFLAKTQFDCLCATCLLHFENLVTTSKAHHFPQKGDVFVENLHYYTENNYWVFTEMFHLLRGHCCKSGCRHCPYGFKK